MEDPACCDHILTQRLPGKVHLPAAISSNASYFHCMAKMEKMSKLKQIVDHDLGSLFPQQNIQRTSQLRVLWAQWLGLSASNYFIFLSTDGAVTIPFKPRYKSTKMPFTMIDDEALLCNVGMYSILDRRSRPVYRWIADSKTQVRCASKMA